MTALDLLKDFLAPVSKEATQLLGIRPASGADDDYVDPKIEICARAAFSQVETFLKRSILFSKRTERYSGVGEFVDFKNHPVKKVTEVRVRQRIFDPWTILNGPSTADPEWSLDGETLYLRSLTKYNFVEADVQGGFEEVTQDSSLYNGLLVQTIALYNRKETKGLTQVKGSDSGGSVSASDKGELVQDAKVALESLVYYGTAEDR